MGDTREEFFKMVDQTSVHPLVGWARDEIVRLENQLATKEHKLDLAKTRHASDKNKLEEMEEDKEEHAKKKPSK